MSEFLVGRRFWMSKIILCQGCRGLWSRVGNKHLRGLSFNTRKRSRRRGLVKRTRFRHRIKALSSQMHIKRSTSILTQRMEQLKRNTTTSSSPRSGILGLVSIQVGANNKSTTSPKIRNNIYKRPRSLLIMAYFLTKTQVIKRAKIIRSI